MKPIYACTVAAILVGLAVLNLAPLMASAPKFGELVEIDGILTKPVEVIRPSGRGSRGPWASIRMDRASGRIDDLCFVWDCNVPREISNLRAGGDVRAWMHKDQIWQLANDSGMPFEYAHAVEGHERATVRRALVLGAMMIATLAILGIVFARRRRAGR